MANFGAWKNILKIFLRLLDMLRITCIFALYLNDKDMKNAAQEFINAKFNEARANGVDLSTEELQRAYFAANKTKWAYALLASK